MNRVEFATAGVDSEVSRFGVVAGECVSGVGPEAPGAV